MAAATTPVHENQAAFLGRFAERERELRGDIRFRREAIERFAALGFPTTRNEDWKYTNLTPYLKTAYEPAAHSAAWTEQPVGESSRLVFLNGRFAPQFSVLPEGVKAGSLWEALNGGAAAHIARHAAFEANAMVALNTALFEDGAFIEIASGAVIERPIYLYFSTTCPDDRPCVTYPRSLIVVGREAQARIVEEYAGAGTYFTNAVTELVAGEGAVIEHYMVQREATGALHYHQLAARQGRASSFASFNVALGGGLARTEIAAVLDGEGAECTLNGLFAASGTQHVDNYTTLDHAQPHATSHELYKGILDGQAQGVFHGRIIVRPEAQKTDAIQRNRNLLLSKDAVINTKPQLEIYADDVRCTHGATVGQVDEDAVFYLRSRGIALEEARTLLTYAFASEILDQVKVEGLRARLGAELVARLSGVGK